MQEYIAGPGSSTLPSLQVLPASVLERIVRATRFFAWLRLEKQQFVVRMMQQAGHAGGIGHGRP